jgi:hypothetical protein
MVAKPSSRRFQFHLRTLLIFVTVFCVASGWSLNQIRIVQERKALLNHVIAFEGFFVTGTMQVRANKEVRWSDLYGSLAPTPARPTVPCYREWFGDEAIGVIGLHTDSPRLSELRDAFPEAKFSVLDIKK